MADAYNPSAFPVSYKDPEYAKADASAAQAVGVPVQLLSSIRTKGERSNADQISSAGAATPYQITPDTRQAIIQQTGVDPWLNPQTAAYGAAYLLKQNLDRYGGNPALATAAYIGGTDQQNWGPKTLAYVKRVTGHTPATYPGESNAQKPSNPYQLQPVPGIGTAPGATQQTPAASLSTNPNNPYALQPIPDIGAAPGAVTAGPSPLQQVYQAYKSGKMSPQDAAQFEQDVSAGRIVLPVGMDVAAPPAPPQSPAQPQAVPQSVVDAFNGGHMSMQDAQQFQQDVASGKVTLPQGAALTPPSGAGQDAGVATRGFLQGAADSLGGAAQAAASGANMPLGIAALNRVIQDAPQLVNHLFGTHFAESQTPAQLVQQSSLPRAQTPAQSVLQAGAQGAGAMAVPMGEGESLAMIPRMVAAGAAGGTVGEAVHQATGSPGLGLAANLLTTVLSPAAASRVMTAITRELPGEAAAAASRIEPTMQASGAAEGAQAAGTQATPATPGTQAASPVAAPAPTAAADTASAEQAGMGNLMMRMQEGQAQAAAGGVAPTPQSGFIGAQEAAGGADLNPSAASAEGPSMPTQSAEMSSSPAATPTPTPAAEMPLPGSGTAAAPESGSPTAAPFDQAMVPDDPDARAQIVQLMQDASGQNRTIAPDAVQAARQQLLARFNIDPQAADAAREFGMIDDLHPDHLATDIQMIKINQLLKSDPTNPMAAQEAQGLTRVGQKALDLFGQMGATSDLSSLSAKANQMLAEQNAALKGSVRDALDKQIPEMIPKSTQVPATNSLAMINQELDNLGGKSALLSRDWKRAKALLEPSDEMVTVGGAQVPGSKIGIAQTNPTYHAIDTLRKQLNAADRGAGPFVNMEQASRRQLAQSLSQDQGNFLQQTNPQAYALWRSANEKVGLYKAIQNDMQTLFGKNVEQSMLPTLKNAIQGLQRGNVENFGRVVNAIPKSIRNEAITSALQNMFTRAGSNELGPFGFQQAARFFGDLKRDSNTWNALMGNLDPETRATLSKFATLTQRISNSISQKIYTGRSRFAKDLTAELNDVPTTTMERIRGAVGPAAGRTIGGTLGMAAHKIPFAGAVLGPVAHGIGAIAERIISPNKTPVEKAFANFITSDEAKDIIQNGPSSTQEQIKAAANSPSFRELHRFMPNASGINNAASRESVLRAIIAANAANNRNQNR